MKKMKGIFLLLAANVLIFVTLSVTFNVLLHMVLPAFGIDLRGAVNETILLWSFVLGFGGAFVSLALSKQMVRMMLPMVRITQPRGSQEQMVYSTVEDLSRTLGVTMPEVWIYDAPDPNAFATGPSKNNSMVAVSTGLLRSLDEREVRAVLAHEMGHVINGDMFTTTVLTGLMNTFVYFLSNLISRHVAERNQMAGLASYIFLQVILSFLAMIPICWFSRRREFAADRFAAQKYGAESMISALRGIDRFVHAAKVRYSTQDPLATMKISGSAGGWFRLFATHPPIEARIARLEAFAGMRRTG
ncbi:MAG TPA: protease HtpX [Nitrospiria bacterium]